MATVPTESYEIREFEGPISEAVKIRMMSRLREYEFWARYPFCHLRGQLDAKINETLRNMDLAGLPLTTMLDEKRRSHCDTIADLIGPLAIGHVVETDVSAEPDALWMRCVLTRGDRAVFMQQTLPHMLGFAPVYLHLHRGMKDNNLNYLTSNKFVIVRDDSEAIILLRVVLCAASDLPGANVVIWKVKVDPKELTGLTETQIEGKK